MKHINNIREIVEIDQLTNEYDLERASLLARKLRLLIKEDPSLKPVRRKLLDLVHEYENKNWRDSERISDKQVAESDKAEEIIGKEQEFYNQRKQIIRDKLKDFDMNQQELGELLGHSKTYISELVNGVSNFSIKDLVIIHRLFKIELEDLVPTFIETETKDEIKQNISRLNKPKLKLRKVDLYI